LPSNRCSRATVLSNRSAGRGYHRIILKTPGPVAAVPGQFVMLSVSELRDPLLARPLSISSMPTKSSIEILYRVAGRGTAMLTGARAGDTLTMIGPLGNGFPLPEGDSLPVLVGGGSGFPPLHFLALRSNPRPHVFIGVRTRELLPPSGVLRSFRANASRVHIATEDGSAGVRGTSIDLVEAFLKKTEERKTAVLYACGPRPMLAAVSRVAAACAARCYVSMEERMACGTGVCMGCSIPVVGGGFLRACKDGPAFDAKDIDWSGRPAAPARG
jgi:dihydroorotate dehydrogenase electron transfer subunit